MAEKYNKSKLKRNKPSVKELQPEVSSRGTLKRSRTSSLSGRVNLPAETGRSAGPAAAWWSSEGLPAAERLWALTLKCGLPYLEDQHWDMVPDLPHPSPARAAALKLDEQRWCDLSEEVAPLPEPSPPSAGLSSFQQELPEHTEPGPDPPDTLTASHRELTCPSLRRCEGPPPGASPSGVGGDKGRKEGESRPVNQPLLMELVKVCDRGVSQQREEEKKEEELQRSVRGDGGAAGLGGLQSCPMCLMVFPVGFTQMDCDGHLAQCLMEVNVDITW